MFEINRLKSNISGEKPSGPTIVMLWSHPFPEEGLNKILGIMNLIISAQKHANWPEDKWWKKNLPGWFLNSFNHSIEEIQKDSRLWDFGSWLDALKYRGWEWWSSEIKDKKIIVFLEAYDQPYILGPFEFIIFVSGGRDLKVSEI